MRGSEKILKAGILGQRLIVQQSEQMKMLDSSLENYIRRTLFIQEYFIPFIPVIRSTLKTFRCQGFQNATTSPGFSRYQSNFMIINMTTGDGDRLLRFVTILQILKGL